MVCILCFPSALGKSKKFQRRSYEICLAGVFHSAFRRVNRLHGGERIKKHIPRRPTMLLSPARGNQKADQVVNLVGFFPLCAKLHMHMRRERVTSPRGLRAEAQPESNNRRPEGVWKSTHLFSYAPLSAAARLQFIRPALVLLGFGFLRYFVQPR